MWASGLVAIRKKDGSFKFCVDHNGLNSLQGKNINLLPNIREILNKMLRASVFNILEATSVYHQFKVKKKYVLEWNFGIKVCSMISHMPF